MKPLPFAMLESPAGSRWYALFSVGEHSTAQSLRDHLFELRKKGFNRLFQAGRLFEFSTPESLLEIDFKKPVYILVDRIAIGPEMHQRVVDTIEICYREAGEVIFESASSGAESASGGEQIRFNEKFQCKTCGTEFNPPEPILFSFNAPLGACPRCQGFGNTIDFDMDRVIPDKTLSLDDGAVDPWTKPKYRNVLGTFKKHVKEFRFTVPFCHDLTEAEREKSTPVSAVSSTISKPRSTRCTCACFSAVTGGYALCPDCKGARLRKEALYVRVGGKNLAEVVRMNIAEAQMFFLGLELSPEETAIAEKILVEIRQRLEILNDVGLEYLTLDRLASTLSGGEAQRIQLATSLGSRLVGACYVLDEPSIGLHSRDTGRLIRILEELRELGNTIVVVEHDPDVMRSAGHIVDLGPGAGEHGGEIVFEGPFSKLHGERQFVAHREIPAWRIAGLRAARPARIQPAPHPALLGCAQAPSEKCRRRNSARHAGGGYRGLGFRQVDAGA